MGITAQIGNSLQMGDFIANAKYFTNGNTHVVNTRTPKHLEHTLLHNGSAPTFQTVIIVPVFEVSYIHCS